MKSMFKIGETPSMSADPIEHADYLEIECLRQSDRNASGADLISALGRVADDLPEDRPMADEKAEHIIEAVFEELAERIANSGVGAYRYPFAIDKSSRLLQFTGTANDFEFYLFLLFATRMNMRDERIQGGYDGTEIFEQICCEIAKSFMGSKSNGFVFGTARRHGDNEVGRFQDAVNHLCERIGEGVRFHSHSGFPPSAQDGNLDVVAWKGFTDNLRGKLIAFGQCKTGTHWRSGLFELVPEGFCKKWVMTAPVVNPVRLYFITSRVRKSQWHEATVDGGIVFDRCRILDYSEPMNGLSSQWHEWLHAALAVKGIPLP
jgi:hypothetical protein